jgi:glycosyltransferase involved in cell wall biosynthesis
VSFKIKASIIITTYNWPEALAVTLKSVLSQSRVPEEIVVADDGSDSETADVILEVLKPSGLRWSHVRHEHEGVRQSRIKNLAVSHSDHEYLIFIDQDVVLHPAFVADHLSMAQKGIFLQGKRSLLPEHYTREILVDRNFRAPSFWLKGLKNRKNTLRFPSIGKQLARPKTFETSLRGCNLSMFRSDFLKVDGFDETFDGTWGREDSDFCYRLFHTGIKIKFLWFMALQYHLDHGTTANWDKSRLDHELQQNLNERRVKALKGFSKLSSEGGIVSASKDS